MRNYNEYLRIVMIIILFMIFTAIIFGDSSNRILFSLLYLCSVSNDFLRKKYAKSDRFYIPSFLVSLLIAGTLKYFLFNLIDGYLYILLVEIVFRNKKKLPGYLLLPHVLAFFTGSILTVELNGNGQNLLDSFANDILYYLLGLCVMLSMREVVKQKIQFEVLNAELAEKNQQLEEYQEKLKALALSEERNRVAQEIHDSLGHTLMAIGMNLKLLKKLNHGDTDKENRIFQSLDEILQGGIEQLRETVYQLKNENEKNPLKSSLLEIIGQLSKSGETRVNLDFDDCVDECIPDVKNVVYKAVKECITNAVQHGNASLIDISIYEKDERIHLEVTDNGSGCDKIKKSYGLIGIDERFFVLDGQTSYESEINGGFVFRADIPLYKRESVYEN